MNEQEAACEAALPEANVEVTESKGGFGAAQSYGASRFDKMTAFGSNYSTPGRPRAQANKGRGGFSGPGATRSGAKGQFGEGPGAAFSAYRSRLGETEVLICG